jgi:hypothetical protein
LSFGFAGFASSACKPVARNSVAARRVEVRLGRFMDVERKNTCPGWTAGMTHAGATGYDAR